MTSPREYAGRPAPVVVGVDGSPNSMAALRRAIVQASARGAALEMIYVIPCEAGLAAVAKGYALLEAAARCMAAAGLCVHDAKHTVACGDPAEVLVKHSVGAQLLVIGGRFRSETGGNLLGGDVVPFVFGHAACPVDICADQHPPRSAAQHAASN
jgi:nucleotide-binding universal stress UspA family protein